MGPVPTRDAGVADSAADGAPRSDDDAGADQPRLDAWSAPKDRVPHDRNYVYVESDQPGPGPNDLVILGRWFLYTRADAVFELRHVLGQTQIDVRGDQTWNGSFAAPEGSDWLAVGYYPNAGRVPFEKPGVTWMGEGLGCNTSTGWIAVDHAVYVRDTNVQRGLDEVVELDLRFETRCTSPGDVTTAAVRGEIHYRADDPTRPPGPMSPPPADLWRPARGAPSGDGSYVLLQWDELEPRVFAPPASSPRVGMTGTANANLAVYDDSLFPPVRDTWFESMWNLQVFLPGLYGRVQASGAHNPARAAFKWTYGVDSCFDGVGWFVIDHIVYTAELITELDLRFERVCPSLGAKVLHGQVHYLKQ